MPKDFFTLYENFSYGDIVLKQNRCGSMPVERLQTKNFSVLGQRQKALAINLPGIYLILFKSKDCDYSKAFEPTFHQLSVQDTRIGYGVVELSQNKDVVLMSRQTTTPINGTPQLILYMDRVPKMKFNGTKDVPSLHNFISKALMTASETTAPPQQNGQFMQPNMYGNNQYPTVGAGQAGYNPRSGGGVPPGGPGAQKYYLPEIGTTPSMTGMLKSGPGGGYANLGGVEDEDEADSKMIIPDTVTPYNTPWVSEYRQP
jgi:hypothetical protein